MYLLVSGSVHGTVQINGTVTLFVINIFVVMHSNGIRLVFITTDKVDIGTEFCKKKWAEIIEVSSNLHLLF